MPPALELILNSCLPPSMGLAFTLSPAWCLRVSDHRCCESVAVTFGSLPSSSPWRRIAGVEHRRDRSGCGVFNRFPPAGSVMAFPLPGT
jgi:hypothetical protein